MTVIYDIHDPWKILTTLHGTVWPQVVVPCTVAASMTAILHILKHVYGIDLTFVDKGHAYLGILVSFLVVTRASRALNRFWEARGHLATAVRSCRDLSMSVLAYTGRDDSEAASRWRDIVKERLVRLLRTTMRVIQDDGMSLRLMQGEWDYFDQDLIDKDRINTDRVIVDPLDVAASLQIIIHKQDEYLRKPLDVVSQGHLHACVQTFLGAYFGLTKFNTTPLPFTMINMGRTVLLVFVFSLPFVLVNQIQYFVPCVVLDFFITYGFVGMELATVEMHDPFGDDPNDFEIYRYTEITIAGIKKDLQGENLRFCNARADMMNKYKHFSNRWMDDDEGDRSVICNGRGAKKFEYRPSVAYEGFGPMWTANPSEPRSSWASHPNRGSIGSAALPRRPSSGANDKANISSLFVETGGDTEHSLLKETEGRPSGVSRDSHVLPIQEELDDSSRTGDSSEGDEEAGRGPPTERTNLLLRARRTGSGENAV